MPATERGLTLVELLLCLGIVAILMLELAIPGVSAQRARHAADAVMHDIENSIAMARRAAINENLIVTFCRSDDGERCQGQWRDGSIIFSDSNGNHVLDGEDRLLYRLQHQDLAGSLSFNSFGNRQYLQFDGRGVTLFQNGNFTFCPDNGDTTLIRQLILSYTGRTRMALDADGDGVVENSQGETVTCDS